jgi:hypothetical protein
VKIKGPLLVRGGTAPIVLERWHAALEVEGERATAESGQSDVKTQFYFFT